VAEGPAPANPYAAAAETLRSTARWLLASFAGVAAILVGGLQLTDLGDLDGPRLGVAIAALAGAVVSVGYMMRAVTEVLTLKWISLSQLDDEAFDTLLRPGRRSGKRDRAELLGMGSRIEERSDELFGHTAPSLAALHRQLRETNARAAAIAAGEEAASPQDAAQVAGRARELRTAAREVVDFANFDRTRRLFSELKRGLAVGALGAVVCLTVFAYVTNPPETPPVKEPLQVQITGQGP
jgi:hypothetical protein